MFDNSAAQTGRVRLSSAQCSHFSTAVAAVGWRRFHFGTISHFRPQTVVGSRAAARC